MRLRTLLILPLFLCTAFLFRMYALSFVEVNSRVMTAHRSMQFRRKAEVNAPQATENSAHASDNYCSSVKTKTFKKTKGVISSGRRRTLTQALAIFLSFFLPSKEKSPDSFTAIIETPPAALPRYLALAVLRL